MEGLNETQLQLTQDNAVITEFLTISASVLLDFEEISQKEADVLRISLADIGRSNQRQKPLLLTLSSQQNEFVALLLYRYGAQRLARNIFSYSLIPHISKLQQILSSFGHSVLQKSELYVNRFLKIYENGRYLDDDLALHLLVNMGETLREISSSLTDYHNRHLGFHGARLNPKVDQKIAYHLGMTPYPSSPFLKPDPAISDREFKMMIKGFLTAIAGFCRQFSANNLLSDQMNIKSGFQKVSDLSAKLQNSLHEFEPGELSVLPNDPYSAFVDCEFSRQSYVKALISFNVTLHGWLSDFTTQLRALPQNHEGKSPPDFELSAQLKQAILFDLLTSGSKIKEAESAVDKLCSYLKAHRVLPENILTGEFSKIDPILTTKTLELLKVSPCYLNYQSTYRAEFPSNAFFEEKNALLKKSRELSQHFMTLLSQLPSVILAIFIWAGGNTLLSGCGLKANPQSDVPALRPEIQFRTNSHPLLKQTIKKQAQDRINKDSLNKVEPMHQKKDALPKP